MAAMDSLAAIAEYTIATCEFARQPCSAYLTLHMVRDAVKEACARSIHAEPCICSVAGQSEQSTGFGGETRLTN